MTKIYESLATQIPPGYRLADADEPSLREFCYVSAAGAEWLRITDAPEDELVAAMDGMFDGPVTHVTDQRTAPSLGLVRGA